jgi:hypothetical protein
MNAPPFSSSHSADVQLQLVVDGQNLDLAQIGPDDVIVNQPVDLPPGPAEVVMFVDGRERRWPVLLVEGMSSNCRVAKTVRQ